MKRKKKKRENANQKDRISMQCAVRRAVEQQADVEVMHKNMMHFFIFSLEEKQDNYLTIP